MPPRKKRTKTAAIGKRQGGVTDVERQTIKALVLDQPTEITPVQIKALATGLRRTPEAIKALIAEAREDFAAAAIEYVDIHKQAVMAALANGDSKSLEVARKGAAWAMTNIAAEGERVVERPDNGPQGNRIIIGVQIGGIGTVGVTEIPLATDTTVEATTVG
jgi:hypothetical protein